MKVGVEYKASGSPKERQKDGELTNAYPRFYNQSVREAWPNASGHIQNEILITITKLQFLKHFHENLRSSGVVRNDSNFQMIFDD